MGNLYWRPDNLKYYEEKIRELDVLIKSKERKTKRYISELKKLECKKEQYLESLKHHSSPRECKLCNETLPITNFPQVQSTGPNSRYRRWECKECHNYKKLKDPEEYEKKKLLEEERKKLSKVGKKRCSMCEVVQSLDVFENDFSGRAHENKKSYCKSCGKVMRKNYKESDPKRFAALKAVSDKRYNKTHKKQINKQRTDKYHTNIQHKLKVIIRNRIGKIIRNKKIAKHSSSTKSIGCSYKTLIKHLESQFSDGMTWDNHGTYGWHIDHKIPLAAFDLSDKKQFKEACHYTNLQPLWAEDNYSKGDKLK
jgi:hypothetical protein